MLSSLKAKPLKGFILKPVAQRNFSGAASIRNRFHEAWLENNKKHTTEHREPENKQEYGSGYIQRHHKRMTKGYTHPYHSKDHPMLFSSAAHGWDVLSNLVGPEQVSPHFESFSRSRRGLIFLFFYVGAITNIARLGGWDHNEWIRGMVFHHEYLLALYVGYSEIRHFTWLPGPKFTVFYDVFSRYEAMQLGAQWNDTAEQLSQEFYQKTREQIEYMRIHNEYRFIKKRSLVTFLTNERLNLEKHFHDRTLNMLSQITSYEEQNLKNKLNTIAQDAFKATMDRVENDDGTIKRQAFEAALDGIRKGKMDFSEDPVLPMLKEELHNRTGELRDMTPEEESNLLSLKSEQRRSLIQMDKGAKENYLSAVPHVSSQGLKSHDKFVKFVDYLTNINKKDVV